MEECGRCAGCAERDAEIERLKHKLGDTYREITALRSLILENTRIAEIKREALVRDFKAALEKARQGK